MWQLLWQEGCHGEVCLRGRIGDVALPAGMDVLADVFWLVWLWLINFALGVSCGC